MRGRSSYILRAFTLIEVLVVVAIIGLLVAILVPSLSRAREQAKRTLCLSNMKQMGLAFSAYASDSKGLFPWPGNKRYALMGGEFEQIVDGSGNLWLPINIGGIYPKYVSKQALLFYCPSCRQLSSDDQDHGIPKLQYLTKNPVQSGPSSPHNFPFAPQGTYVYARPAATGRYPRDAGAKIYPLDVLQSGAGTVFDPNNKGTWADAWQYINDSATSDWLIPISKEARLRSPLPAFVSDAYFGGFLGYHIDGYNVLYADLHGRRVRDPNQQIAKAGITSGKTYSMDGSIGRQFQVWDYFGRNP